MYSKGKLNKVPLTWSGYNSHNPNADDFRPPASIGIFPEFSDKAVIYSMQKHGILMIREATDKTNAGQTSHCLGMAHSTGS